MTWVSYIGDTSFNVRLTVYDVIFLFIDQNGFLPLYSLSTAINYFHSIS